MSTSEMNGPQDESKVNLAVDERTLQFQEGPVHQRSDVPVFKKHHESSTIELFYDLFFVANLSTFTANHEINSADCTLPLSCLYLWTK